MKRHPFDPVSLVFGILAIGAGVAALTGRLGELLNEPAALVPITAGVAGLALIGSVLRRPEVASRPPEPAATEETMWRDPDVR